MRYECNPNFEGNQSFLSSVCFYFHSRKDEYQCNIVGCCTYYFLLLLLLPVLVVFCGVPGMVYLYVVEVRIFILDPPIILNSSPPEILGVIDV